MWGDNGNYVLASIVQPFKDGPSTNVAVHVQLADRCPPRVLVRCVLHEPDVGEPRRQVGHGAASVARVLAQCFAHAFDRDRGDLGAKDGLGREERTQQGRHHHQVRSYVLLDEGQAQGKHLVVSTGIEWWIEEAFRQGFEMFPLVTPQSCLGFIVDAPPRVVSSTISWHPPTFSSTSIQKETTFITVI